MPLRRIRQTPHVRVVGRRSPPWQATMIVGGILARCALGPCGIRRAKREGDGATPAGTFRLVAAYYRADRLPRPRTALPLLPLRRNLGWCDDPADRMYNRPVDLPYPGRHERMWRDDHLYDIVVVVDFNLNPVRPGAGSAIFLHLARPGFAATEGCVAVDLPTMRRLLALSGPGTVIAIG